MSKKIVIANWKMNPMSAKEAENLFNKINKNNTAKKIEVVICPPVLYLSKLKNLARKVKLGAQNIFSETSGSYTGETGAEMIYDIGARYVIVGHSERRALGENNSDVSKKIKSTFSASLVPILCVGEKERDEAHEYLNFIKTELTECLAGISKNSVSKLIVAYEPVWAIGKNAVRETTAEEFREMKVFIKKILCDKFGVEYAEKIRIIYGGSVNPKNALDFLKEGVADGLLVGRDSLNPKKFAEIISITENVV